MAHDDDGSKTELLHEQAKNYQYNAKTKHLFSLTKLQKSETGEVYQLRWDGPSELV
jgi:hypothetical protein